MTTSAAHRASRVGKRRVVLENPKHDSVWAWLWYGISAGLLAIVLGIAVVAIALPRLTGTVPLTVVSRSMEPALPPGTMLVVRPLVASQLHEIRVGDIVSYQPNPLDPALVTHRVTNITSLQDGTFVFTTKGDANPHADPPARSLQVRAKLWYSVPGLGWVNDLVNTQGNRAWIIPATAGLLFAYAAYVAVTAGVAAVRKRRHAARGEPGTAERPRSP